MYAIHFGIWFPECGALPAATPAGGLWTREEPRRARSCKTCRFWLGTAGSHSSFWQPPDGETQDPGSHSWSWKAGSSGGCKSFCPFPCISSLFQFYLFLPRLFAWLVPVLPIWVHFLRFSPLLCSAPGFPQLHCCSVPLSSPSLSDLSKCPFLSLWLQLLQDSGPNLLSSVPAWLNLFSLWSWYQNTGDLCTHR